MRFAVHSSQMQLVTSGAQVVHAFSVFDDRGRCHLTTTSEHDARTYVRRYSDAGGRDPAALGRWNVRCHRMSCRKWFVATDTNIDMSLGWAGYCEQCVRVLRRVCRKRYRRYPDRDREFFCPYCHTMRKHPEDRCPREADGRTRIMCKPCRQQQLAKRQQRKRGLRAA